VRSRSAWIAVGGTKLGADEAVRQQVGQPGRVVHVGLAAGHVPDVHRVGEHELERFGQDRPDRLPIHAGRLHRGVGDPVAGEPARQALQLRRRRAEGLDEALDTPWPDHAGAGHHAVAVDVEPAQRGCKTSMTPSSHVARRRREAHDVEL
jgi:hypothetical protein